MPQLALGSHTAATIAFAGALSRTTRFSGCPRRRALEGPAAVAGDQDRVAHVPGELAARAGAVMRPPDAHATLVPPRRARFRAGGAVRS